MAGLPPFNNTFNCNFVNAFKDDGKNKTEQILLDENLTFL